MTAIRRFRCQPGAVPAARRFVRQALRDQPVEIIDAAELLTSELATNSVRHAQTDFELAVRARGQIRIEVRDTGRGQPRLLSPSLRDSTGRGLLIVDSMADAWGVVPVARGKIVWFTLPHSAAASEAFPPEASSPMDPGERHAEPTQERMTARMPRRSRRSPRGASRHREVLRRTWNRAPAESRSVPAPARDSSDGRASPGRVPQSLGPPSGALARGVQPAGGSRRPSRARRLRAARS